MGIQGFQFIFELAIIIELTLFSIALSKLYRTMVFPRVSGVTKGVRMY